MIIFHLNTINIELIIIMTKKVPYSAKKKKKRKEKKRTLKVKTCMMKSKSCLLSRKHVWWRANHVSYPEICFFFFFNWYRFCYPKNSRIQLLTSTSILVIIYYQFESPMLQLYWLCRIVASIKQYPRKKHVKFISTKKNSSH